MYRGTYTLIGTQLSMFTRKLEAQLTYQRVPYQWQYKTLERTPDIETRAGTRFIPLLQTPDGWMINDTIAIGPFLSERFPEEAVVPATALQRAACYVVEDFFNHWLPRHALHSRWIDHDNAVEAGKCFGANMLLDRPLEARRSDDDEAAVAGMGDMMRDSFGLSACDIQGAGADQAVAVESDFHVIMGLLKNHFEHYPFLLGNRACLADFALVGPVKAHFLQDPLPLGWLESHGNREALEAHAERVYAGLEEGAEYLPDDALPETLVPLLEHARGTYHAFARASIAAAMKGDKTFTLDLGHGEFTARSMKRLEKARQHVRDELSHLSLRGSVLEGIGALALYAPASLDDT
jgi:glutathione S-transferase